jgi:hypothetical protein
MYYMKVANRQNDFTLGYEVRAYETKSDRQKALDYLWDHGSNGMFCSRKEVEQNYGKDFDVYTYDEQGRQYTHLDPFCKGIVDTEFYKNERSYTWLSAYQN